MLMRIRGGSRGVSVVPRNYSDSLKFISSLKFYIMHITNSAILYNARCMSISRQLSLKQCFTRVKKRKPSKFLSVVNYSW